MKPVLAILVGHHGLGTGTGTSRDGRDEWALARGDALELYLQLTRDGIIEPHLEPIAEDDNPAEGKSDSLLRSARWALVQKLWAVIEIHYNSFTTDKPSGHLVCSNRMTPFVECMARALDVLPNRRRDTVINAGFVLPSLLDPVPFCLLEPAFIFEPLVAEVLWRPMLVAAIKAGLYKYFNGGE